MIAFVFVCYVVCCFVLVCVVLLVLLLIVLLAIRLSVWVCWFTVFNVHSSFLRKLRMFLFVVVICCLVVWFVVSLLRWLVCFCGLLLLFDLRTLC